MTAPLTLADFAPRLNQSFSAGRVKLRLVEASPLPDAGREGGSFRLEFEGPADAALAQGIHAFEIGGAARDVFIVPVAARDGAISYEAIFY